MRFKVGDKVVRTKWCPEDYTVKQGGEYTISKVDDECNSIYLEGVYDNNGQPDWFNPDNFELVESVNDLAKAQKQVAKELTPFEKKGWTENSIFKVINAYDSCFEVGDLVVIDSERGDYDARFKLLSEYGQYRKPFINWLKFEGLEYVGELGEDDMIKENKDYRSMSPDVLIPISIDGNVFEVKLGSLVLLKKIIGMTNGAYLCEVYGTLENVLDINQVICDFDLDNDVCDINSYSDDLFTEYFKSLKEKKTLQAQIKSLQEQLKALD